MAFSPDGTKLASGSWASVKLSEVSTGKIITTFQGGPYPIMSVAFSSDDTKLGSASLGVTVLAWNLEPADD